MERGVDEQYPAKIWTCVFVPGGDDEQARGQQGGMAGLASCSGV